MSTYNTILENLVTEINGISSVRRCERYPLPADTLKDYCPFVCVLDAGEIVAGENGTNLLHRATVHLSAFTKDTEADLAESMTNLIAELKTEIYSPVNLGDNCLDMQIISVEDMSVSGHEDLAAVIITCEILYYSAKATF